MLEVGGGILGLILLIIDIWAIIKIAGSSAGLLSKIIWILIILFLPFIGLIIWWFFGPKG